MPSFKLISPPALEPITLAEAKLYARIDTDADDTLVASLITAARQWAEAYTGRAFVTQSWQLALDAPPFAAPSFGAPDAGYALVLPRAPLQSVTQVQAYDDADTATTWPSGNYFVDKVSEPGRLVLRSGASWPSPTRTANGLVVTYVVGYGDAATDVPEPIRAALRALTAFWYEHRGEADDKNDIASQAARALLAPYRLRGPGL